MSKHSKKKYKNKVLQILEELRLKPIAWHHEDIHNRLDQLESLLTYIVERNTFYYTRLDKSFNKIEKRLEKIEEKLNNPIYSVELPDFSVDLLHGNPTIIDTTNTETDLDAYVKEMYEGEFDHDS